MQSADDQNGYWAKHKGQDIWINPDAAHMCRYDCKLCIWFCLNGPTCAECGTGSKIPPSVDLLESPQSSLAPLAYAESSKGDAQKCHPGDANMQENHGDQDFTVGPAAEPPIGEPRMQRFGHLKL